MNSRIIFVSIISCSLFFLSCAKGESNKKISKVSAGEINGSKSKEVRDNIKHDISEFKGNYIKFKQIQVYDYNGFAKPVAAYTLLLPEGWKVTGGIKWNIYAKCLTETVTNHLRAESPDGKYSFEMFPIQTWEWMNDAGALQMAQYTRQTTGKGCMLHQPMNASQFISQIFIPEFRPGAQKIKAANTSGAAAAAREKSISEIKAMLQTYNADLNTDAVLATIRYNSSNGEYDEWVTASVTEYNYNLPSAMNYGSYYKYFYASADEIISFSAPKGELEKNDKLFSTIMASFHLNPVWGKAISDMFVNISNIQSKGAMDRSRIWSNAMNEIGEKQYQSWQNREDSQDRIAQNWSQYMRGVETYVDPNTNTSIELSSGYNQAWSNGNGEYILSEDPNFNPNEYFQNQNWGELKKKE